MNICRVDLLGRSVPVESEEGPRRHCLQGELLAFKREPSSVGIPRFPPCPPRSWSQIHPPPATLTFSPSPRLGLQYKSIRLRGEGQLSDFFSSFSLEPFISTPYVSGPFRELPFSESESPSRGGWKTPCLGFC